MVTTTKFIWDEDNYLLETDESDANRSLYTNEPNEYGSLISQRVGTATAYFHFDAIGSTREITGITGLQTDAQLYRAWGDRISLVGSPTAQMGWVGEVGYYHDLETEDNYVRFRYYETTTGRWKSRDPIAGFLDASRLPSDRHVSSQLQSVMAPYTYVGNMPIRHSDPSGLVVTRVPTPKEKVDACKDECKRQNLQFLLTVTHRIDDVIDCFFFTIQWGTKVTVCICLDQCIFYHLWCVWGATLPNKDKGKKFWPANRIKCGQCYDNCRQTGKWPFADCPIGGRNGPRFPGDKDQFEPTLPDDWHDLLPPHLG